MLRRSVPAIPPRPPAVTGPYTSHYAAGSCTSHYAIPPSTSVCYQALHLTLRHSVWPSHRIPPFTIGPHSRGAYDEAVTELYRCLDKVEELLGATRYIAGRRALRPTLVP